MLLHIHVDVALPGGKGVIGNESLIWDSFKTTSENKAKCINHWQQPNKLLKSSNKLTKDRLNTVLIAMVVDNGTRIELIIPTQGY